MIYFLKAKHWKIFILFFVIPFFSHTIIEQFYFLQLDTGKNMTKLNLKDLILNDLIINQIMFSFFLIIFFLWIYSIINIFKRKIPKEVVLNRKRFNLLMLLIPIYFFFITILIFLFLNLNINISEGLKVLLIIIIIPLHLLFLFGYFYIIYFVAKTIKTLELQRNVIFSDFITEFFLMLIIPVGIWILQPKINELYNKHFSD